MTVTILNYYLLDTLSTVVGYQQSTTTQGEQTTEGKIKTQTGFISTYLMNLWICCAETKTRIDFLND